MALETQTYEGLPGGMNLALPAQEIPDEQARFIVDGLVDVPGIIRRRGPLMPIDGVVTFSNPTAGIVTTLDPNGSARQGVLQGNGSNAYFSVLSADLSAKVDLAWNGTVPTSPFLAFDAAPALGGGSCIGSTTSYGSDSPVQTLAFWKGGINADYSTGTITTTRSSSIGSVTVTGSGTSWAANVSPGMFLFANTDAPDSLSLTYMGVVKSVDSDTSLTLEYPAPHVCTAKAYSLKSIRGFQRRVGEGRITASTGSAVVNGGLTKFKTQKMETGSWFIYRASDYAYIGKVTSVTSDIQLTLTANANVAVSNERYVAIRGDGDWSINTQAVADEKVGFVTTQYAERQWYANNGQRFEYTTRLWYSDPSDAEVVDMTDFDGTHITIGSTSSANTPVKALVPTSNALLIFKDNETYAITGSSPTQFATKKVQDDGALSGMAAVAVDGGAMWAGKNGIYFYDGVEAKDISEDRLGQWYREATETFNPATSRVYAMRGREHVFFHFESFQWPSPIVKGVVSETPDRVTICVNMATGGLTLLRNFGFRGHAIQPTSSLSTTYFLVNTSTTGYICDIRPVFDETGNDTITCDGDTIGPDFFLETKKYAVGDSLRKKLFKQLAINYLAAGGALRVDTVVGLNSVGRTSATTLPATVYTWDQLSALAGTWDILASTYATWESLIDSVFRPKRVKFLKRSQHFAFRIYQDTSAVTRVVLGPFQLGFKYQRPGRI